MRQTAVYQQYDASTGRTIWIFIGASPDMEDRVDRYMLSDSQLPAIAPFSLHLAMVETSLAGWRWYLAEMTERVQQQVRI